MAGAVARSSSSVEGEADAVFNWDDREMRKRWDGFTKFGNATASEMTGKNFDKWLKDAGVLDSKNITTTMTGIAFSKVTGPKRKTLSYPESKQVLVKVAQDRSRQSKKELQEELDAIIEKLAGLEGPSRGGTTKASSKGVYDRLTDTSKYTGSHKERFDDAGKGRGKAGREEQADQSGYVGAYKNKGKYDEMHGAK